MKKWHEMNAKFPWGEEKCFFGTKISPDEKKLSYEWARGGKNRSGSGLKKRRKKKRKGEKKTPRKGRDGEKKKKMAHAL